MIEVFYHFHIPDTNSKAGKTYINDARRCKTYIKRKLKADEYRHEMSALYKNELDMMGVNDSIQTALPPGARYVCYIHYADDTRTFSLKYASKNAKVEIDV